jgi:SNF2 family DNA or RNA helicase
VCGHPSYSVNGLVVHNSHRIKSPSAKRTKTIVASGRYAKYKRILTGTPVTNSPFDLWPQIRFLDPDHWKNRDFGSLESFKTFFGVWEERINSESGRRFQLLLYYKNLDRLGDLIEPISSRLLKEDVLDLPPRTYEKRFVSMSPEQAKLYQQMKDECFALMDASSVDGMVTAQLVITQMLRLQQILCGYLPSDDGECMYRLETNPRLEFLQDVLKDVSGQVIIWCRFREDVEQILERLGDDARHLYGGTPKEDRVGVVNDFQEGKFRFLVSTPDVGGRGWTLTAAKTMVYYSSSYNLEFRLQSEDRNHRHGQDCPVHIIDIVASGTQDVKIVSALVRKQKMAAKIQRDELKEWL